MKTVLIIGGGAAGITAALAAAENARVILLERSDRVGKKILSTGNGRCNLTNRTVSPRFYRTSSPELLPAFLEGMTTGLVLKHFRDLGLLCADDGSGRIYPVTNMASTVLDVLLLALERKNVEVRCGAEISAVKPTGDNWTVQTASGESYTGDALVLTCGGKAAPKLGTDGRGFALAKSLGHGCTRLYPALTALQCDMRAWGNLKGIRAGAAVSLIRGGRTLAEERGEVQFTEYGVSGIPVFQISAEGSGVPREGCRVCVDLFPDVEEQALRRELLSRRREHPETPLEQLLTGLVHKRLGYAVMKQCGLSPLSMPLRSVEEKRIHALARALKRWEFSVLEDRGYDNAQVTGGGIPLNEIDCKTMESKICKGLFLAGEILDVTGLCGGYNLHWAWCSGLRAGQNAGGGN